MGWSGLTLSEVGSSWGALWLGTPPHPLRGRGPHLTPPGLKKWVEVGNSGVFRPELLLPMGLPENVSVIAWGLSLER